MVHRLSPILGLGIPVLALGLLVDASRLSAQPPAPPVQKIDGNGDLQKQIDNAIKELEKIAPDEQTKQLDELRRQLENARGQLDGMRGLRINGVAGIAGRRALTTTASRFGAYVQLPPAIVVEQLDLPANKGLAVINLAPNSPAEKAGIKINDILVEFAGKPVESDLTEFTRLVRDQKEGEELDAVVIRRGKRETIKGIKLTELRDGGRIGGFNRDLPAFVPEQRIPPVRIENLPGVANLLAGAGDSMKVRVENDSFLVETTSGKVKATLKGNRGENGKMRPQEFKVQDGDTVIETRDMTQVPEIYRPLLERMMRSVGAGLPDGARRE